LLTLFAFSAFALAQEIHCVARLGDFEKDQKLVNAKDEFGWTPLQWVAPGFILM